MSPPPIAPWRLDPGDPTSPESRAAALFDAVPAPARLRRDERERHIQTLRRTPHRTGSRARLVGTSRALAFLTVFAAPVAFAAAGIEWTTIVSEVVRIVVERAAVPTHRPDARPPPPPAAAATLSSVEAEQLEDLELTIEAVEPVVSREPKPPARAVAAASADQPEPVEVEELPASVGTTGDFRALLRAGDAAAAQVLLTELEGDLATGEAALLWGELHFAQRDCRAALTRLTQALASTEDPSVTEEALYHRAVCHAWLGDALSSHADIDQYLLRFPSGRYVEGLRHRYRR